MPSDHGTLPGRAELLQEGTLLGDLDKILQSHPKGAIRLAAETLFEKRGYFCIA